MLLYPAIDLRGGRVVRLQQGDYAKETVYGDDPSAVAKSFADAGCTWIHVVDLDAARDGGDANLDAVAAIVAAVPSCRVQTGGGVRSVDAALRRLDLGVARVVVGSAAVERPEIVAAIASERSGAVAVGLDVRGREVSTHGWTRGAGLDVFDLVERLGGAGAAAFVVTQIDVDGLLTGPDIDLYRELLDATAVPVVASGGVGTLADLTALGALVGVDGRRLDGSITGKALYEGRFSVEEGIAACSPRG